MLTRKLGPRISRDRDPEKENINDPNDIREKSRDHDLIIDETDIPQSVLSAQGSSESLYIDTLSEIPMSLDKKSDEPSRESDADQFRLKTVDALEASSKSPQDDLYNELRRDLFKALPHNNCPRDSKIKSEPVSRLSLLSSALAKSPDVSQEPPPFITRSGLVSPIVSLSPSQAQSNADPPAGPSNPDCINTRIVLISGIPAYWNPQILYDIFAVHSVIQGTYIYDIRTEEGYRDGLLECASIEDAKRIIDLRTFPVGQVILTASPSVINTISDVLREYPRLYDPYGWQFAAAAAATATVTPSTYPLYPTPPPPHSSSWTSMPPHTYIPTGPSMNYHNFSIRSDSSFSEKLQSQQSGKRIFIKNLCSAIITTESDLRKMFEIYGTVIHTKLCQYEMNPAISFGFVTFASTESARRAVLDLDCKTVSGHQLQISYAVPRIRS